MLSILKNCDRKLTKPDVKTGLLIVDPGIADTSILLDGLRPELEVLFLRTGGDGLEQIARHLASRTNVASLHVLSHGEPGALWLAGQRVDSKALDQRAGALNQISSALSPNAEVTFYGCSLAGGPAGRDFVDQLETALGAAIAAAVGPVGSAARGGAWDIKQRDGGKVHTAFSPPARERFPGLLATATLTTGNETPALSTGNDTVTANAANAINAGDVIDGQAGTDILTISATQSVVLGATTLTNFETITITAGTQTFMTNDGTVASGQTLTIDGSASSATISWNGAAETDGTFSFTGSSADDSVTGGSGADTVSGAAGNDFISAGAGSDSLLGGTGNDQLSGGSGGDTISGGDGNDTIVGAAGADSILGDTGDDLISAGADADTIFGGAGNDTFTGSAANHDGDTISDFVIGDSIVVTGTDLSSLDNTSASGTIDLGGGQSLTLTGISSASGTFGATFSGGNTTITMAASVVSSTDTSVGTLTTTTSSSGPSSAIKNLDNTGSSSETGVLIESTGSSDNIVYVTLPASASLTSSGPNFAETGSDAVTTLIDAIDARDATGEETLLTGAQCYLITLATSTQLQTRTVIPSVGASETETESIVFTGTTGSVQSEALVIDMRSATGATLQLNNIEFASIIGETTVTGGEGSNFVVGDDMNQYISLGAEDDTIYGGDGYDTVGSGSGSDYLYGDAGNDSVFGGDDADVVYGGTDQDSVFGNVGADIVFGNQGLDTLFGGQGSDSLYGGQHADILYGNKGDDLALGNLGDNTIHGNEGNDTLFGGRGNDLIYGNSGDDSLIGSLGDDTLSGGAGNDTLIGSGGSDRFHFTTGDGADTVQDFTVGTDGLTLGADATLETSIVSDSNGDGVSDLTVLLTSGDSIILLGVSGSDGVFT